MADRTVTITSTKLIIAANGLQIRFYGLDIISATPIQRQTPNVNTGAGDWFVDLALTGEARDAYLKEYPTGVYPIRLSDVSNQSTWRNDLAGAQAAAAAIAVMIRSVPSGGGGGQVDTIVGGVATSIDSTDPANPISNVLVDGVTIGVNGLNQLEVPAGGGGYVPTTRTINTTAPLTGGGDLSANRTIAIPQATAVADGFLDSADWTTFNSKVSSVGATYPIQSSGGATPTISADTSLGGNFAADAGKVLVFGAEGEIKGSSVTGLNAVEGLAGGNGIGLYGENTGVGPAIVGTATGGGVGGNFSSVGAEGVLGTSDTQPGGSFTNNDIASPALHVQNNDATNSGDLGHFHRDDNLGLEVRNDGALRWTSATGAQLTANALPVFGALTKGVVPAAGAVPVATNFLDETGAWSAPAGPSGAALTRTDDTNVTLTLGGSPSTALLAAASITAGWTGSLAVARGGTGGTTISDAHTNLEIYNSMRVLLNQSTTLTNQPNSLEMLTSANPGLFVSRVDLTNMTEVMLQIHVFVSSASGNTPRVILRYSTSYAVVAGSYSDIGTSAVTCSMAATGIIQSGWIAITALAQADVYITGLTNGGNGAADPQIQGVTAFFR